MKATFLEKLIALCKAVQKGHPARPQEAMRPRRTVSTLRPLRNENAAGGLFEQPYKKRLMVLTLP